MTQQSQTKRGHNVLELNLKGRLNFDCVALNVLLKKVSANWYTLLRFCNYRNFGKRLTLMNAFVES